MTLAGNALGTPVWGATDDHRRETWLLSDLHVAVDGGPVVAHLQAVLTAASRLGDDARVFLLGDLFDSYVGARQLQVGVWREVVTMLRACTAAGVSVTVLHGNRDFLLDDSFAAVTGCRVVAGGVLCRLAGHRTLLLHGDELCVNDRPYQRAKRWLRSPAVATLARWLPLPVALRLAARARARSGKVIRQGDQSRFLPTAMAIDQALAQTGAERLVFGHIHRLAHGVRPAGEYRVLPAFDQQPVVLRGRGGAATFEGAPGTPDAEEAVSAAALALA